MPSASPATPGVAPLVTPRATLRPRFTPTVVPVGPYGPAPRALPLAVCGLQAVAFVLAALLIVRRSLNRLPAAPAPRRADAEHSPTSTD
jgi:hypothetical protein